MAITRASRIGVAAPLRLVESVVGYGALIGSLWLLGRHLQGIAAVDLLAQARRLPSDSWIALVLSPLFVYGLSHAGGRLAALHLAGASTIRDFASARNRTAALTRRIERQRTSASPRADRIFDLLLFKAMTLACGVAAIVGSTLAFDPYASERFAALVPPAMLSDFGKALLGVVIIYAECSLLPLPRIRFGLASIRYPAPATTMFQILIASATIVAASMLLYFALPGPSNPGPFTVAWVFAIALFAGVLSRSPAGLGVFEWVFIEGLSETPVTEVMVALALFRLAHLPLILSKTTLLVPRSR